MSETSLFWMVSVSDTRIPCCQGERYQPATSAWLDIPGFKAANSAAAPQGQLVARLEGCLRMMFRYAVITLIALLTYVFGSPQGPLVDPALVHVASAAAASLPAKALNAITVTNKSRAAIRLYPLQFGRPFLEGAIPSGRCPVMTWTPSGGSPVALSSQADVKNRYPDGSVEFAVMATLTPAIPANGSGVIAFSPGICSNTPLTSAQMLDPCVQFRRGDDPDGGAAAALDHRGACVGGQPGALQRSQRWQLPVDHQWRVYDHGQRRPCRGDRDQFPELQRELQRGHQCRHRRGDPRRQICQWRQLGRRVRWAAGFHDRLCQRPADRPGSVGVL